MCKTCNKKHKTTLMRRLLAVMFCVLLFQSALFACAVFMGRVMPKLDEYALNLMNERTVFRRNYIENEALNKWMNIDVAYQSILLNVDKTVAEYTADGHAPDKETAYDMLIDGNPQLSTQVVNSLTADMVYALRLGGYTGIFAVFGQNDDVDKYGLYLHDNNPETAENKYADINLEISPYRYDNFLNMMESSYNDTKFRFSSADEQWKSFFARPYAAYKTNPELPVKDLGWWSTPFTLNNLSFKVITYSLPLVTADNRLIGVIGIDVSDKFLHTLLPFGELDSDNNGVYMLSTKKDGELVRGSTISSGYYDTVFYQNQTNLFDYVSLDVDGTYMLTFHDKSVKNKIMSVHTMRLYNHTSPFYNEEWEIASFMDEGVLFSESAKMTDIIVVVITVSFLIGVAGITLSSYFISRPITLLTRQINKTQNTESLSVNKLNIAEIDDLTDAIENLNERFLKSQATLSQIIGLVGTDIGAFEFDSKTRYLFTTPNFAKFINLDDIESYDYETFSKRLSLLSQNIAEQSDGYCLFNYTDKDGKIKLIETRYVTDGDASHKLGLARDITSQYFEKQRLIKERNYDSLTNIFNRRAFYETMDKLFGQGNLGIAAFIIMDLDNLKFINDTYGHDFGDIYIKKTAETIVEGCSDITNKLIGRRSGDEFYVFLYGYEDKTSLYSDIENLRDAFNNTYCYLADDTPLKVRISGGVALYPDDAADYNTLITYADFAMYEIKNSAKGQLRFFDADTYAKDSYLINKNEELNKLLDGGHVEYHYQPIVDAKTGNVFGYEALMRPLSDAFENPQEILSVAKAQSKLNVVEEMTFSKTLKYYSANTEKFGSAKLFINSISNQQLSFDVWTKLKKKYRRYFKNIVVEMTEHEKSVRATEDKLNMLKIAGCEIAIDDYGTGYNSIEALLKYRPRYIKLDISLIRHIDVDANRRALLSKIIAYANEKDIKCIGEGVETEGELKTLIELNCDYIQGYLLAKPSREPCEISEDCRRLIVSLNKSK